MLLADLPSECGVFLVGGLAAPLICFLIGVLAAGVAFAGRNWLAVVLYYGAIGLLTVVIVVDGETPGTAITCIALMLVVGPIIALALLVRLISLRRGVKRSKYPPGHCEGCGYNLTGNVSGMCSECGTMIPRKR